MRIVVGALFAFVFSLPKFADHANELADFQRFGVPLASTSVVVAALVELIGGLSLLLGLLTRAGALLLAGDMVVAIVTAGRNVGGALHLGVAPLMLLVLIALVITGSGRPAVDEVLARSHRDGDG